MNAAIGIAIVLLVLCGPYVVPVLKRIGASLKSRAQSLPSMGGLFTATMTLPIWKYAVLQLAFVMIASGGSWTLPAIPTTWNLPAWFHVNTLPLKGMRVMILDETAPAKPLTPAQTLAIRSLDVREYLDSKTLADSKGGKGWRKIDPDSAVADLAQEWQDIRPKLKPTEYPWVAVADSAGTIVFEGPYPTTDTLAFFKKYGG